MFDNLRDSSDFYEEGQSDTYQGQPQSKQVVSRRRRRNTRFLGLTAQQRFLLSVMLFFTVCVVGALALFVLGKMSLF
jgi:hypothetical protein